MKKIIGMLSLVAIVSCGEREYRVPISSSGSAITSDAAKICFGQTVAGISGTADCSAATASDASKICSGQTVGGISGTANCSVCSISDGFYVLSSRNDLTTIDMTDSNVLLDIISGTIDRSNGVATLSEVYGSGNNFLSFFTDRYQVIPNPVTDSDGRWGDNPQSIEKKHYLETIVGRPTIACGNTGTIPERIADCSSKNTSKAFYNGRQYGSIGEGNWKLVIRLTTGEEVWRDERTKLLWSDEAANPYNWFQASGYSKDQATSQLETSYDSQPGSGSSCSGTHCQPANPISVCAEVNSATHKIIGGGAETGLNADYQDNPETAFKGNLGIAQNVLWKLPSIDDYKLADINGIRKVLNDMDNVFWTSSSYSFTRSSAWYFQGAVGSTAQTDREMVLSVRCVAFPRD